MRVISALIAMAGVFAAGQAEMIPSLPNKYERVGKGVAQAKREALKLRRRKAHRMHCRGSRS